MSIKKNKITKRRLLEMIEGIDENTISHRNLDNSIQTLRRQYENLMEDFRREYQLKLMIISLFLIFTEVIVLLIFYKNFIW